MFTILQNTLKTFWQKGNSKDDCHCNTPLNPWAFIRVCNEEKTLQQSLNSILGAISKGVIVYHECIDRSESIIQEFCQANRGFKSIAYPHRVAKCRCSKDEFRSQKTLADYYNFALSFIPKGEWLIKIDCDQIYDAKKLKESFCFAKSVEDIVFYFRINLHCFSDGIYIDKKNPISDHKDHWLICNNDLFFTNDIQECNSKDIHYWELLQIPFSYNAVNAPLNTWHFPLLKQNRSALVKKENYTPLSCHQDVIPQHYLNSISPDMLDEKRILRYLKF